MRIIQSIIFDLDGTLIDSVYAHAISWAEAFRKVGLPDVSSASIVPLIGLPGRTIVGKLYGSSALKHMDEIKREKDAVFLSLIDKIKVFPEVVDVLRELKSLGIRLGLATSTTLNVLSNVLNSLKLNFFDVVIAGDSVKRGKPYPDIFLKAIHSLNTHPRTAIIVGDTDYDVIPAMRMGSISVIVLREKNRDISVRPDFIINSLDKLIQIIRKLNSLQ